MRYLRKTASKKNCTKKAPCKKAAPAGWAKAAI
jgi:hypothetical protein